LNEIARDCKGSGDSRSVAAGHYAELADEGTGHVTLIREASLDSSLGGCLTVSQESPGEAHAPLNKICMRRYSYLAREAPQELEAAHARQCR
jgi:hypothetical protein